MDRIMDMDMEDAKIDIKSIRGGSVSASILQHTKFDCHEFQSHWSSLTTGIWLAPGCAPIPACKQRASWHRNCCLALKATDFVAHASECDMIT